MSEPAKQPDYWQGRALVAEEALRRAKARLTNSEIVRKNAQRLNEGLSDRLEAVEIELQHATQRQQEDQHDRNTDQHA